jgi:NAD(P)-dependent dehydrogenase (short-subunit alcohol dehydrogenase family)
MVAGARRIVVVGASTGLGRCIALDLAGSGAHVALLARRKELLEQAAVEAKTATPGARAVAVACDVSDEDSCRAGVAAGVEALGGLDGFVYCPAIAELSRIEDLSATQWRRAFDTNVIGAAIFTTAALPHLVASYGSALYLSSVSASFTAPWPGLATYTVTKAALDKLVDAWRAEHPEVAFTRLTVGDCAGGPGLGGSQFINEWDVGLLEELYPGWLQKGLLAGRVFDVGELLSTVDTILGLGPSATIPSATIVPRQTRFAASIIAPPAPPEQ